MQKSTTPHHKFIKPPGNISKSQKHLSVRERLIIFMLFFLAMDFMNLFFFLIVILFFITILIYPTQKSDFFTINSIVILLFGIFYMIFLPKYLITGFNAYIRCLIYFMGYFVGRKLIRYVDISINVLPIYLSSIALGAAAHGALSNFYNFFYLRMSGFSRQLPDIWSGQNVLYGATAQASLFLLFGGSCYYILFLEKRNYFLKIVYIIGIILLFFNAFMVASRSAITIPIVSFALSYITYMFIGKNRFKNFIALMLLVCSMAIVYTTNMGGIKSYVESLPLLQRVEALNTTLYNDSRFSSYSFFINNMYYYPFGGLNDVNPISFMHNLWLDVYADAGLFPFIFLIIITISVTSHLIKILKMKQIDSRIRSLIIGVYTSILLIFFTEPMIDAAPWFVVLFFIIYGMTDTYQKKLRNIL